MLSILYFQIRSDLNFVFLNRLEPSNMIWYGCEKSLKMKAILALTFDFKYAEDVGSSESEWFPLWALKCSIRRLLACEEVSEHSSCSFCITFDSEIHLVYIKKDDVASTNNRIITTIIIIIIIIEMTIYSGGTYQSFDNVKKIAFERELAIIIDIVCKIHTRLHRGCSIIEHNRKILIWRNFIPQLLWNVWSNN